MALWAICVFLPVQVLLLTTVIPADGILCVQCTNLLNGVSYDFCPMNGPADVEKAYKDECNGACFTRIDTNNSNVVSRGCTSYMSLPLPLPPKDDCYDWMGTTFCICRSSMCNFLPIKESSGVSLDDHLQGDYNATGDQDGPLQCYECLSHDETGKSYPQCPKHHRVNPTIVYRGNCSGACFTRSDPKDSRRVIRGCTDSQYGLPEPLPEDGCYNWNDAVYCICTRTSCNGRAIEQSSGKDLDYRLDLIDETDFEEPDGLRRCYQCINYDEKGNYYRQCPKHKRVRNAFLDVCNGSCFSRSYDYDTRSEPLDIEFDAHLPEPGSNAAVNLQPTGLLCALLSATATAMLVVTSLFNKLFY